MPYAIMMIYDRICVKKRYVLKFHAYLKLSRRNLNLTQSQLALELYNFDAIFDGLDVNTIGRWERAVTNTPILKKVKILAYFFEKFNYYFPFLEMNDIQSIEKKLSSSSVNKFLGKHKQLVMSFPTIHADEKDFQIVHSKKSLHQETAFTTAINICDDMYGYGKFYSVKTLHEFALFASTLFLLCEYKEQYFGHAFFIYLKNDIYKKVMNFEMDYMDITTSDLANVNEKGSYMSMGLFAMNEKAMAILFVRFYAHLIINQKNIQKVGTLISDSDAVNMAKNFGLQKSKQKDDLIVYDATIKEVLLTQQIIKMLF